MADAEKKILQRCADPLTSSQPFGGKGKSTGEVPVSSHFISPAFIGVTGGGDKVENGWR